MKMSLKVDLCALWRGFSLHKDRNNIHKRSAAGSAPCCSAFCSRSRGGQVVSRYHWVIRLRMGMTTWIDDATECDDYKPWGDDTRYKNVETTSNSSFNTLSQHDHRKRKGTIWNISRNASIVDSFVTSFAAIFLLRWFFGLFVPLETPWVVGAARMNHLHATTVPWFHLELLELMSGLMCFFNFPRIFYAGALHIYIYVSCW